MYNCVLLLTPDLLFLLLPLCLLLSLCVAYQCAVLNLSVNKSLSFLSVLLRGNKHCIDYNLHYYYVAIEILHVIIDTMMTWIMMTNCYWKLSENIKKFIIKTLYDAKQEHFLGRRPFFLYHWYIQVDQCLIMLFNQSNRIQLLYVSFFYLLLCVYM